MLEVPAEAPVVKQAEKSAKTKADKPAAIKQATEPVKKNPKSAEAKSKAQPPAIGLTQVTQAWRDVRSLVKPDHPNIEALLNSCRPVDVRGSELYLGFQSDKVRELFDIPERVAIAQKAITEVLGIELTIKCVITNARGQLPPDVNPDGMVAAAIQNGGEIVDVQE